eukprot:699077-Pleurochrysis_carterae.AAC.4
MWFLGLILFFGIPDGGGARALNTVPFVARAGRALVPSPTASLVCLDIHTGCDAKGSVPMTQELILVVMTVAVWEWEQAERTVGARGGLLAALLTSHCLDFATLGSRIALHTMFKPTVPGF